MTSVGDLAFLIVDGSPGTRRVVRELLRHLGWQQVEEADSAIAALQTLRQRPFDVVLAELHMPGMDGYALLQSIKDDPALRRLPVLAMAAQARKDDLVRAACGGAAGYIVKPIDRATLELKLDKIVQRLAMPA